MVEDQCLSLVLVIAVDLCHADVAFRKYSLRRRILEAESNLLPDSGRPGHHNKPFMSPTLDLA